MVFAVTSASLNNAVDPAALRIAPVE